ncbi:MAG: twin-arginine translocase subunit TatC [Nitrososphaerota archaeon]|nr:twin-arginine translocase subunit TatC [Nitrososphaerales archaeon]MDW8044482.1 twin-arginine translocase subunit TatC [Nitrososphaerota archaeon]
MSKEMTMLEHLEELRSRLIKIMVALIVIFAIVFSFRIQEYRIGEFSFPFLYPDIYNNFAMQFVNKIKADVVPEYVQIIVTTPQQAFLSAVYIAIFLSIIIGMPVIIYEIGAFVNPALYPHERRLILTILGPATALFISGCLFSYTFVIPWAFAFLYRYALSFEAMTTITLDSLISFVLLFLFAFGIAFQLPIIMYLLTKMGVVEPSFWKNNFRVAIVIIVIFGAIITPDGSGITMWFIALPMLLLYSAGYLFIKYRVKGKVSTS